MITRSISDKHKRVVPMPKKAVFDSGYIKLDNTWVLKTDGIKQDNEAERIYLKRICEKWSKKYSLSMESDKTGALCLKVSGTVIPSIDNNMDPEEYIVTIEKSTVNILSGSVKGIDYAMQTLWQISPDGNLPTGRIEDKPSMKIRGFHLNFDSFRQMDINEALYVLETAADLKLNTVLIEYSNRFPFENHKQIAVNTTLLPEDILKINKKAQELGLEIIPLQQTIGHLEYLLRHDQYEKIRENLDSESQICPLNPLSIKIVEELLDEIIQGHPGIRYIHLGGDEARSLGKCLSCKDKVEKHGISKLYIDYMNSICEYVINKGLTPIIWDDMLCAHPEALDLLDKRIVIMYWDYWTVSKSSPYFIARYDRNGKPVQTGDSGWDNEWKHETTDLERSIMNVFVRTVPLKDNLSDNFMNVYGNYLGDEFPKRIKGFPYIEFYQNKGFKVLGAPTCLGNGDDYNTLPNYWRFIPNIKTAAERCIEAGTEGMVTTAWYNYHPAMFHMGIGATAQFSWGVTK